MPRPAQLGGVFLVSAAGLLFQFAQTRLFSATLGYHLTFLVVSGALMGVAIGATAAATLDRERQRIGTSQLAIAAALAVLAALVVETQIDPLVVGMFPTSAAAYALGDPLARVDVMRFGSRGDPVHYAFLVDPSYRTALRPPALAMELDMGALTPIIGTSSPSDLAVLDASVLGAPYELAARSNVLVIGPGGGLDVMTALRHGARSVTAVEVNRAVVALMRGRYAEYSGGVYADTRVHLVEDEARSFVRRSTDRYDLVVMTVVDSFAALSSGAYALTESYLYTQEAMADYLAHLAPGGSLSVGRWYRDPPVEIVRTFKIAVAGLTALGKSNPETHIAVLRYGNFGLLLIGDRAYAAADVERLRGFATSHGFEVAYDPLHPGGPFTSSAEESPATDDRPFFFDTVPLSAVLSGRADLPYGYGILFSALLLALALGIGFAVLPLYAEARRAGRRRVPPGTLASIAIGLGFIATELVLLQRLTLS